MDYNIAFAPELQIWLITAIAGLVFIPVAFGLLKGVRGAIFRLIGWGLLTTALLNPSLLVEDRDPLKSIVAVVTDESGSQKIDGRAEQTQAAKAQILQRLATMNNFEIREITAGDQLSSTTDISSALFSALKSGLKDVPQDRLAGAIMITDGQVHDIPETLSELGFNAPVHALITGKENEKDRRIVITEAPRYGVVGEGYEITYEVLEKGFTNGESVAVSVFIDGELITVEEVVPGETYSFIDDVRHGGRNVIELQVETHPEELTETNNRVFTTLNGIRENLRVLLVSGEPHAGERTWRNLLKSDASVDLVHFTILRPPEKQDGTPISQLSLIAFPTRELFVEKIDEFDLIIFDRYSRRGVLPILYFDNIARYVRDGGAVLLAAGPEFSAEGSIADTPLNDVLPAMPNGLLTEAPFKPLISELGNKHPVTRDLDEGKSDNPDWSRWFRSIGVENPTGDVIMTGSDDAPLLVLNRYDEGRVALLLSDHAWLWARGFEGGGPHVQLLRRMAHWLMREPELEEERLTAESNGTSLIVTRQTLGEKPDDVVIKTPTGDTLTLPLAANGPGTFSGEIETSDIGLYQVTNDELSALVHVGPPNPREYVNVLSSSEILAPLISQTRGTIQRVNADGGIVPRLLEIRPGNAAYGNGWIGLQNAGATVLNGINRISLFAGLLGLALLLFAMAAMWTREGR
ncbi:MAG: hypothetical protein WBC71_02865 [Salaquimonas sp.]